MKIGHTQCSMQTSLGISWPASGFLVQSKRAHCRMSPSWKVHTLQGFRFELSFWNRRLQWKIVPFYGATIFQSIGLDINKEKSGRGWQNGEFPGILCLCFEVPPLPPRPARLLSPKELPCQKWLDSSGVQRFTIRSTVLGHHTSNYQQYLLVQIGLKYFAPTSDRTY